MDSNETIVGTVVEILGRTGSRGGVTQCRVQVIQKGRKPRLVTRNVIGPIRKKDKIILLEAEREARRMK